MSSDDEPIFSQADLERIVASRLAKESGSRPRPPAFTPAPSDNALNLLASSVAALVSTAVSKPAPTTPVPEPSGDPLARLGLDDANVNRILAAGGWDPTRSPYSSGNVAASKRVAEHMHRQLFNVRITQSKR